MDRGAWWAPGGYKKLDTAEHEHTHSFLDSIPV